MPVDVDKVRAVLAAMLVAIMQANLPPNTH